MSDRPPWTEPTTQRLVRYEALVKLLDEIQAVEDVTEISALIATQWKYFANVTLFRMVIANGEDFMVIDGFRGEARVSDEQALSPWDKAYWESKRPQLVRLPLPPEEPAPPEHLTGKSVVEIKVLPFFRGGRCIGLLSVAAADRPFSDLDDKFIQLFGVHFADRISGILLQERTIAAVTARATVDTLTGLPNRAAFVDALHQTTARARRGEAGFAVLYLDLDHFKDVNDTLGHPIGDLLLQSVARRLKGLVREVDTVARFGGDEFAILMEGVHDPADAAVLAEKLLGAMDDSFWIEGIEIRTGASVGIAVHGNDAPDPEALLSHADVALYRSKSEGRGTYRFFTEAMDTEVRTRVTLSHELRDGIANGQLMLVYQPQVDIETGAIVGIEALVRWRHPTRGLISPGEFIPVAEKSGLIVALGRWVLHEACRQTKAWLDAGLAPPAVSVNVSALQLRMPNELDNDIAASLAETGLPPEFLHFELTESVFIEASREHNDELMRLNKAGHRIVIDDFGIGYSSLHYLAAFPVDCIKIAQAFTSEMTNNTRDAAIVKAAIGLAHDIDVDVVAEGVETAQQLELVKSWGCRKVQGYFFSKPLPPSEMAAALKVGRIVPAQAAPSKVA